MATVSARIERTPYETHVWTDSNVIVVDEPVGVGGQDRGMKPGDLLAASLASCTLITLRMYADRKGWPLESAVAHVDFAQDSKTKRSLFTLKLVLNGSLTNEQRIRLLEIADHCPIHKVMQNPIDFDTLLIEDTPATADGVENKIRHIDPTINPTTS